MPTVTKQTNRVVPPKPKTGALSRAVSVTQAQHGGLHISIYGRSKTGKTRLLSTFPKPLLILGAEDGTKSIKGVKDVDFLRIVLEAADSPPKGNYVLLSELLATIDSLRDSQYKSVAMDTASALQDIVLADMLGLKEVPLQWQPTRISDKWGKETRGKYGERALAVKGVLDGLMKLPQHIAIVAQEMNHNEEETAADLLFPQIGSALSKSTATWLNGAVDYICQTFIREKVTKTDAGGGVMVEARTGVMEYCLRTGPHDIFQTGFRVDPGVKVPDVITDPTFNKILAVINDTYYAKK